MMSSPEFDKRIRISLSLLIGLILSALSLGGTIVKVLDNDTQREEMKQNLEHRMAEMQKYLEGEIDGHRKDEDRRYNETIQPRLNKLESKHE